MVKIKYNYKGCGLRFSPFYASMIEYNKTKHFDYLIIKFFDFNLLDIYTIHNFNNNTFQFNITILGASVMFLYEMEYDNVVG